MNIKEWAKEDRPREKMIAKGAAVLTDAELLAILLRSGIKLAGKNKTAVDLAKEVLHACDNSLLKLSRMSLKELERFEGLGQTKATTIMAALELGRRRAQLEETNSDITIRQSTDIFHFFHHKLCDLPHEELWALYLSKGAKVLHQQRISQGGTDFSGADIKMIVEPAIHQMASNVVLCHNHPHGNPRPSTADRNVTKKVGEALKLFDIRLLDHIIISDNNYYSMCDEGDM